jgi:integrase
MTTIATTSTTMSAPASIVDLPARSVSAAELDAARLLLARLGVDPADLIAVPAGGRMVPTFAEYVPTVSAAVSVSSRRAYSSYWNKVVAAWGQRRLDEVSPTDIEQLGEQVRATRVVRANSRDGASAVENLYTALRCLYTHAEREGLITADANPARKVAKPRRHDSLRHAVPDTRLAEIYQVVSTTGNDPELDTLLLRIHVETACRRGGALALRPMDLDAQQCLIRLREKGGTQRWQPVSPTLMAHLQRHAAQRQAPGRRGSCCATEPGSPSRTAATITCGSASVKTCPGSPRNRSAPTGCATPP